MLTFDEAVKDINKYAQLLGWHPVNTTIINEPLLDKEIFRLIVHRDNHIVLDQSFNIVNVTAGPEFIAQQAKLIMDLIAAPAATKH